MKSVGYGLDAYRAKGSTSAKDTRTSKTKQNKQTDDGQAQHKTRSHRPHPNRKLIRNVVPRHNISSHFTHLTYFTYLTNLTNLTYSTHLLQLIQLSSYNSPSVLLPPFVSIHYGRRPVPPALSLPLRLQNCGSLITEPRDCNKDEHDDDDDHNGLNCQRGGDCGVCHRLRRMYHITSFSPSCVSAGYLCITCSSSRRILSNIA
jgi:hypothetical protein